MKKELEPTEHHSPVEEPPSDDSVEKRLVKSNDGESDDSLNGRKYIYSQEQLQERLLHKKQKWMANRAK